MRYFIVILLSAITGCTISGPEHDTWNADEGESLLLEAEHRVLINTVHDGRRMICAEPSPDALSLVTSSLKTKLGANKGPVAGSLDVDKQIAETATILTERTQAIQFLRDGLYRACEAHINGLLGEAEYRRILVSYDEILIALIAIEQLGQKENTEDDIKDVVRDYYCLQMTFNSKGNDPVVIDRLCKN